MAAVWFAPKIVIATSYGVPVSKTSVADATQRDLEGRFGFLSAELDIRERARLWSEHVHHVRRARWVAVDHVFEVACVQAGTHGERKQGNDLLSVYPQQVRAKNSLRVLFHQHFESRMSEPDPP